MNNDYFISVDWGTTNLRVRLVRRSTLQVEEEISSPVGIKSVFEEWCKTDKNREDFFFSVLDKEISLFQSEIEPKTEVIISGMASSTIGIKALPYATFPFKTDGSNVHSERIHSDATPFPCLLISGLSSDRDVMRGEETQLIGLVESSDNQHSTLYILPGTHSKHILCNQGMVINIETFMTGELFEVVSKHSMLRSSIQEGQFGDAEWRAFEDGVCQAYNEVPFSKALFSIRTNALFHQKTEVENYYYLSGLIIGEELTSLKKQSFEKIKLCAGEKLSNLYFRALTLMHLSSKIDVVHHALVNHAVIKGHSIIMKNRTIKNS